MYAPLNVVQDGQGSLRDLNGQPMIMIYDSKPTRSARSKDLKPEKASAKESRSFAFINIVKPNQENQEIRKLIRTHVMLDLHQREKKTFHGSKKGSRPLKKKQGCSRNIPLTVPSFAFPPWQLANKHASVVFPIEMQPYMHRLFDQCKYVYFYLAKTQFQ
jgi:hypothetical protein